MLLILGVSYIALQNSWVQTRITQQIAFNLSKKYETEISIGHVDIGFFKRLKLEDVLIKDQSGDTLIYSEQVNAKIDSLKFRKNFYVLEKLKFTNNRLFAQKDTDSSFNFNFLLNSNNQHETKDSTGNWIIRCRTFDFDNSHFSFSDFSSGQKKQVVANNLHLSVTDFHTTPDSTSFLIRKLSFTESNRLTVEQMSAQVISKGQKLHIEDFNLKTKNSVVNKANMEFQFYSKNDSMNRTFDMNVRINASEISMYELGVLVPALDGMRQKLTFSGLIYGSINDLKGKNIFIETGNETNALLDFYINDLRNPESMYLFLDLKSSKTSFNDISNIRLPNNAKNKFLRFPESFYDAGELQFKGNFSGFLTDFVTFGTLTSEMGILKTDILVMPEQEKSVYYRGNISTTNFKLGELLKLKNIGAITLAGSADGKYDIENDYVSGIFEGDISSINIKDYTYQNISFDGVLRDKMFDGLLEIQDPNLEFSFLGELNLNEQVPRFDFNLNLRKALPGKLNLSENFPATNVAFDMDAKFTGDRIDNLNGVISINKGFYGNRNGKIDLKGIKLEAYPENGKDILRFTSNYLDADIKGAYYFIKLKDELTKVSKFFIPSGFWPGGEKTTSLNNFNYRLNIKEVNPLVNIFIPGLDFETPFLLYGNLNTSANNLSLKGSIPSIKYGNNWARDIFVGNQTNGEVFSSRFRIGELLNRNGFNLYNLSLDTKVWNNTIDNSISWSNYDELTYSGAIRTKTVFNINDTTQKAHIEIEGSPSNIYIADTLWSIHPFQVNIDSSTVAVKNVKVEHNEQTFALNGSISRKSVDLLQMDLKNIELSYLDKYFKRNINLNGKINGSIGFSNLLSEPVVLSDIVIDTLYYKGKLMGDASLTSRWNRANSAIETELKLLRNDRMNLHSFGSYTPESGAFDFDINVDSASLLIMGAFMRENFSNFTGTASGSVHLGGTIKNIDLNGALHGQNAGLTIDVTQVPYTFTDSVYFKDDTIHFDNLLIFDDQGNNGIFDGIIVHENFRNMTYDLNFASEKMRVLNTTSQINEQFYGNAIANGSLRITGKAKDVDLIGYGTTLPETDIKISMESESELQQYEFLEFVKPEEKQENPFFGKVKNESQGGFNLGLTVQATSDAKVQLIYNSQIGDVIKARGEGILLFEMDNEGNMSLSGNYTPTKGDYLFTLQNVMNKRFSIKQGGSIIWSGDPYNAIVDLEAIYKLKASLYDLLHEGNYNVSQTSRVPVECIIKLTDELINPTINFDINFPSVEAPVVNDLSQYFSTEEELNKQILSLIVMGKFYTPEYMRGSYEAQNSNMIGTTASEVFSNQLSNWLSQIDEDWDIGINYRPGNQVTDDEIELALSTQILNDRVTLNGNIGNNANQYNANNTSQIVGDFEMSVKLVPSGKIQFKAYNRSNNNLIYETAPYTQGIGLSFKEEYNSIEELFQKLSKIFRKKNK